MGSAMAADTFPQVASLIANRLRSRDRARWETDTTPAQVADLPGHGAQGGNPAGTAERPRASPK